MISRAQTNRWMPEPPICTVGTSHLIIIGAGRSGLLAHCVSLWRRAEDAPGQAQVGSTTAQERYRPGKRTSNHGSAHSTDADFLREGIDGLGGALRHGPGARSGRSEIGLDLDPASGFEPEGMTNQTHPPAVAVTGLRKSYGDKTVLDGIDLTIPEGTIFALLAPNGACKTTTLPLLPTLIPADAVPGLVTDHDAAPDPRPAP